MNNLSGKILHFTKDTDWILMDGQKSGSRIRDKHSRSATLKQVCNFSPEGQLYRYLISWTDGDKVSELAAVVVVG
jgi:hypothetical protein